MGGQAGHTTRLALTSDALHDSPGSPRGSFFLIKRALTSSPGADAVLRFLAPGSSCAGQCDASPFRGEVGDTSDARLSTLSLCRRAISDYIHRYGFIIGTLQPTSSSYQALT